MSPDAVSPDAVAIIGFVVLFALMLLRVPVGMAMGLVGVSGFAYLVGGGPALKLIGQTSMRTVTDYTFGVIPMFLLMGAFVTTSGMSRELFGAANTFVGHLRGGLGIATIVACAGFAAISGSSGRPPRRSPRSPIRRCAVTTIRSRSRPA
jgi:C4-dicarboxylate transporter DctM subunit